MRWCVYIGKSHLLVVWMRYDNRNDNGRLCSYQSFPGMTMDLFLLHQTGCKEGKRPEWQQIRAELRIRNWPCSFW